MHELAHQWFGDDLALGGWQHIWLNEGFATYAEWLWSEHEGRETAQEIFDRVTARSGRRPVLERARSATRAPDALFDSAVYARGAATLHALRREIGDEAFFRLLRRWARCTPAATSRPPSSSPSPSACPASDLERFFDEWVFSDTKPDSLG